MTIPTPTPTATTSATSPFAEAASAERLERAAAALAANGFTEHRPGVSIVLLLREAIGF